MVHPKGPLTQVGTGNTMGAAASPGVSSARAGQRAGLPMLMAILLFTKLFTKRNGHQRARLGWFHQYRLGDEWARHRSVQRLIPQSPALGVQRPACVHGCLAPLGHTQVHLYQH